MLLKHKEQIVEMVNTTISALYREVDGDPMDAYEREALMMCTKILKNLVDIKEHMSQAQESYSMTNMMNGEGNPAKHYGRQ